MMLPQHLLTRFYHKKTPQYALMMLNWGMIAACCWLCATWTWFFITPTLNTGFTNQSPKTVQLAVEPIINAHLFGISTTPTSSVVPTQSLSALGLKLHGVFAGEGKKGVAAIINIGQKDQAYTLDQEVVPGAILKHVYADYVEIEYHGSLARLALERTTQTAGLIIVHPNHQTTNTQQAPLQATAPSANEASTH